MTNPLYTISTLPTTSQAAIREFDDRYLASIGAAPPPTWADMGALVPTPSPMLTFPIGSLALKYQQTEGEERFKTLREKSFDMKVEKFDVGVEADVLQLATNAYSYQNWLEGPRRMMIAEARRRNRAIVTLLEAGQSTLWGASLANPLGIDGVNFFSATHLSDFNDPDSTTWSNYQSAGTAFSIANLKAEITIMQGALDENAEKLGAEPDTILVPTALYEPARFLLAQNLILQDSTGSAGVTNPYASKFNLVHVPELTDVNDWYLVDSKLLASSGLPPWISLRYTPPNPALELKHWDESSDFFKDTNKIKVSSNIWRADALAFPHAIRKVTGA
jgi:hypothetical protein